ncbi:hypothetical protein ABZ619_24265 [Streptomyces sp. NPDC007851]|uniref:ATP-binding protein n=1 Tax=Streptomyces sp. NPDC007851 TaxID=3155008 RepID=UPI0033D9232F
MHLHRRDLRAVREARGFVRERLDDWGLADLSDDLTLITSELVTNALVHAGSRGRPGRRPGILRAEHGRGLYGRAR